MKSLISAFVALIVVVLLLTVPYVVNEKERALIIQFKAVLDDKDNIQPGLHFKAPWQGVVRFDGRILTLDEASESFFTKAQKRLEVDSYAKWRIADLRKYYQATQGDERRARDRLASRINDGLRNEFGLRTLHEVVSGERDELMQHLIEKLAPAVKDELGIELVDVRVKRIDLPTEVERSVFERMRAEREEEAKKYRSEGKEQATIIMADADRQATIIQADAYRQAQTLRGEGDAEAAAIYADAYQRDPDFYAFTRSLKAYEKSFANKSDIMVLEPNSEFFRFLNTNSGK
jgi:membrane protease subunit HflC